MHLTGSIMYKMVREIPGIGAVGGVSVGADPLVCAVILNAYALKDNLAGFFIQKRTKGPWKKSVD